MSTSRRNENAVVDGRPFSVMLDHDRDRRVVVVPEA